MWCPKSKKVIQSRDVTFNETAMLSSGEESVVSSTGAGDQQNTSMEIEVKTVAVQGGAANKPKKEAQVMNLALSVMISLRWRLVTQ